MEKETIKTKRLSVDIPEKWHYELKTVALKYNVTITNIITKVILELLHRERKLDEEK